MADEFGFAMHLSLAGCWQELWSLITRDGGRNVDTPRLPPQPCDFPVDATSLFGVRNGARVNAMMLGYAQARFAPRGIVSERSAAR